MATLRRTLGAWAELARRLARRLRRALRAAAPRETIGFQQLPAPQPKPPARAPSKAHRAPPPARAPARKAAARRAPPPAQAAKPAAPAAPIASLLDGFLDEGARLLQAMKRAAASGNAAALARAAHAWARACAAFGAEGLASAGEDVQLLAQAGRVALARERVARCEALWIAEERALRERLRAARP
jgi:HPt (histidine-containing phosphotransfer) domain-containing protein